MKKCITIGGSGFIGTNLIQYLRQHDCECDTLSRRDLYDMKRLDFNAYETVIDLAGLAHDLKKGSDQELYYKSNFELTKRLYDQFLKSGASKFIFISTVKAAADEVNGALTENLHPNPKTDYGRTKLMAEQYILRQTLPPGKYFYILRPCLTHGGGNKGNLNLLYQLVNKGIPYPLAGFNNKRSFLSVQNLCFIIKELMQQQDIPSDVYNIADDQPLSTAQVISILAQSLNKKPVLWKISPALIGLVAKVGDALHLPLTTERLQKLTENYVVSNSKIKAVLKKPLPLDAAEGLKLTARYFADAT